MREFAKFGTGFWTSQVIQSMSDDGKLLAAYTISGPHSNQPGVYRLPDGYVEADLGWPSGRVKKGFAELSANGFAYRCETTFWMVVMKALKHTPPENPNQVKHVVSLLTQFPANATIKDKLIQCLAENWEDAPESLIDWLNKPFDNPLPTLTKQREGEREKKEIGDAEGFALFWESYPRKVAKPKAEAAWKKQRIAVADRDSILAAIEASKLTDSWQKNGGEFIPHPASWLNARRWEDGISQPSKITVDA